MMSQTSPHPQVSSTVTLSPQTEQEYAAPFLAVVFFGEAFFAGFAVFFGFTVFVAMVISFQIMVYWFLSSIYLFPGNIQVSWVNHFHFVGLAD
jgi:hypothetical protein